MELERFVAAQDRHWPQIIAELEAGSKQSHWIWYVFPQLEELGGSDTAKHFGLEGLAEARAYLDHPVLEARLLEAMDAALASGERDPVAMFGGLDAKKVQSSMTLFAEAAADPAPFERVLEAFYDGARCRRTLGLIEA